MISASKFYSVLGSLSRKGLVKKHRVNLGGRGGLASFLEITEQGCEAIDVKPRPHLARGGNFVTDVWIYRIMEHFREIMKGWKISAEREIQGRFMDIVIEGTDQPFVMAVEVELSDANLERNIKGGSAVDFLVEACISERIMEKARDMLKDLPGQSRDRIGICLLAKMLQCRKLSGVVDSEIIREKGL